MGSTANVVARLDQANTALFVCDIQERFAKAIDSFDAMVDASSKLLRGAQILKLPVYTTEQNPKALGATVEALRQHLPHDSPSPIAKTRFSMVLEDGSTEKFLQEKGVRNVMIVGIESHVCVLQTTLDLLSKGYGVFVIRDAVSSCNRQEVPTAVERMRLAGATVTSSESALFELMRDASHPNFKQISGLIKEEKDRTRSALEALISTSKI